MFHGKKSLRPNEGVTSSNVILAIFIALLIAVFIYWLTVYNAPISADDYYY
jgi:hypothetical protein